MGELYADRMPASLGRLCIWGERLANHKNIVERNLKEMTKVYK